jgi:histone deacetylase 1/2
MRAALIKFGFTKSRCDPSFLVYNHSGSTIYVLIYVDDILLTGSAPQLIQDLINKLHQQFLLKQLGQIDYFLGIEAKYIWPQVQLCSIKLKYIR